jgi:hypothetical protein
MDRAWTTMTFDFVLDLDAVISGIGRLALVQVDNGPRVNVGDLVRPDCAAP